jgi:3-isopropylmalate dehydratase large subunit
MPTLFEKIWSQHVVVDKGSEALLYIDRNLLHDGAFHAFTALGKEGRPVRKPRQQLATADHYVPTRGREKGLASVNDDDAREMLRLFDVNGATHGIRCFGMNDPQQGIVHVIGPETGFTQPGITMTCGDSHTSTHGALGAYAFGIGASQLKQVLATQCLWQKKPKTLRVTVDGKLGAGVTGKDVILAIIAKIGTAGGTGHVIEYAGSVFRALSMEGRLTVCNMSIEAGARAGMVAPDEVTFQYLAGREYAPTGAAWDAALAMWRALPTDDGANFDREVTLDGKRGDPRPRVIQRREQTRARRIRAALHGFKTRHEIDRHQNRPRVYRHLHQWPHRRSARSGGGTQRPQGDSARLGVARLDTGKTRRRNRRAAPHLRGSGSGMARLGLLRLRRDERRQRARQHARRVHVQPQL